MNIEDRVVDFIRDRDWVTFVELQKEFDGDMEVKGDHALEACKNGVLWSGMSKEFSDLLDGLIRKKRIFTHPACTMTYLIDGGGLRLPVPKNLPKDGVHVGYEQPVWLPVCFRAIPYDPGEEKRRERFRRAEKEAKEREIESISEAMMRLVERFDSHKVEKAFFRLAGDPKKQWADRYGLKEAKGPVCAMRLLGRKCREFDSKTGSFGKCECKPPGSDHASLWRYKTNPAVYVFQPYGLSGDTMNELGDYCRKWGLKAGINTWPAWHYPGRVLFVEIYPKAGVLEDLHMGRIKPDEHQSQIR